MKLQLLSLITLFLLTSGCQIGSEFSITASGDDLDVPIIDVISQDTISLRWLAPTTRKNGDALDISELSGYRIYYSDDTTIASLSESQSQLIPDANTSTFKFEGLMPGRHCFSIKAIDTGNLESDYAYPLVCVTLE